MRALFLIVAFALAVCSAQAQSETTTVPVSEKLQVASPNVKIFPNPATNVVNVLGVLNSSKAAITISDMFGNVLLAYEWEIRNNALNIPIVNLKAGIYMISVRSEEQVVQTKFYKQ